MPNEIGKKSQNSTGGVGKVVLAGLVGVLIGVGGTFVTLNGGQSGQGFIGATNESTSLTKDGGYTTGEETATYPVKNQGRVDFSGELSYVFLNKGLAKLPAYQDITVEEIPELYVEYEALAKAFELTEKDLNELAKLAFNEKSSPGIVNYAKLAKLDLLTEKDMAALLGGVHPDPLCCGYESAESEEPLFIAIPKFLSLSRYSESDLATLAKNGLVFLPITDVGEYLDLDELTILNEINNDTVFKPTAK